MVSVESLLLRQGSMRTNCAVSALEGCLTMKTFDLQLAEFDVESADEVLKDVATFIKKLCCLFVS